MARVRKTKFSEFATNTDLTSYYNSVVSPIATSNQELSLDASGRDFIISGEELCISDNIPLLNGERSFTGNIRYDQQTTPPSPLLNTPTGTTQTIDWNNGPCQIINLGSAAGDITVTFVNGKNGGSYALKIIQHASAAKDIIWTSTYFPGGTEPIITTTASAVDVISLLLVGNIYYGAAAQDFQA